MGGGTRMMIDKRDFISFDHNNGMWFMILSALACLVVRCGTAHHSLYTYGPSLIKSNTICPKEFYKVVFDAGSTGTRVFVFQFRVGKKGTVLKLNKEYYLAVKPGISSFANHITGLSGHINELLEFAETKVPQIYHSSTMLSFKATAGLRLLPEEVADKILDEVRAILKTSSFYIPNMDKVEIMSGGEEGVFGWVSANFLLRKLWKGREEDTAITIDLGGGSVQITYGLPSIIDIESACVQEIGDVYRMHLLKKSFNVFTHSALGNGLKSAFLNIMGGMEEIESVLEDEQETTYLSDLSSPCFVSDFELKWQHGRRLHSISGEAPEVSMLDDCKRRVDNFVRSSNLSKIEIQKEKQDLYLFSYFLDVAHWGQIIPLDVDSLWITPLHYWNAAERYCQEDEFSSDEPFLCMSLLYVHSLLSTGFGVSENTRIYIMAFLQDLSSNNPKSHLIAIYIGYLLCMFYYYSKFWMVLTVCKPF